MNTSLKVIVTTLVAGTVGFLFENNGPLGSLIWPVPSYLPSPAGLNLALLAAEGALEAIAFGLGVAFLVFGYGWLRRVGPAGRGVTTAAYLGIAWGLVNWVPHTALHIHHGNIVTAADYGGLVAIEWGFHVTLMAAAAATALFFVRALQARTPTVTKMATPTSNAKPVRV